MKTPTIVIVAFNRPVHLKRLLLSLDKADYSQVESVDLVISIDFQDSEENLSVYDYANTHQWKYGKKQIIRHKANLGLRNHILSCGDLTQEFDSIILLEDDLLVSPSFYSFAIMASHFYADNSHVAGISLYAYEYEELGLFRFYPPNNGKMTYFLQWAGSWGQLWTRNQWKGFRDWYNDDIELSSVNMPLRVKKWKSSWKKYYIAYLVVNNKFFVFPQWSLTTLIDDLGTNIKSDAQVNNVLLVDDRLAHNWQFSTFDDHLCLDSFFQPKERKTYLSKIDKEVDVCFDFYGTKDKENYTTEYVVTSKKCDETLMKFSNKIIPYELNVILDEPGDTLNLTKIDKVATSQFFFNRAKIWYDFRKKMSIKEMVGVIIYKMVAKLK